MQTELAMLNLLPEQVVTEISNGLRWKISKMV